jgi:hypothetical protein
MSEQSPESAKVTEAPRVGAVHAFGYARVLNVAYRPASPNRYVSSAIKCSRPFNPDQHWRHLDHCGAPFYLERYGDRRDRTCACHALGGHEFLPSLDDGIAEGVKRPNRLSQLASEGIPQ